MAANNYFFISVDDIFSSSTIKTVTKGPNKAKKTPVAPETVAAAAADSSIFDDPLNAVGGN